MLKNAMRIEKKSNVTQPLVTNPYPGAWPFKPFFCSFFELLMTFFVPSLKWWHIKCCPDVYIYMWLKKFKFPAIFEILKVSKQILKRIVAKVLWKIDGNWSKIQGLNPRSGRSIFSLFFLTFFKSSIQNWIVSVNHLLISCFTNQIPMKKCLQQVLFDF